MATRRKKPLKKRKRQARNVPPYPFKFRLQVARLHVEDGHPAPLVAEQFGISDYSVYRWSKLYRLYGEQGLVRGSTKSPGSKLPAKCIEDAFRKHRDIFRGTYFWIRDEQVLAGASIIFCFLNEKIG